MKPACLPANGNAQKVMEAFGQRLGRVRLQELAEAAGLTHAAASTACRVLVKNQLIFRVWRGLFVLTIKGYEHLGGGDILQGGTRGPRLGMPQTSMRSRIWRALRYKGQGKMRDLLVLASQGEPDTKDVRQYLNALEKAGYLIRDGRPGFAPTYRLVVNPGPEAPIWNKRTGHFHDPNTGETHALA